MLSSIIFNACIQEAINIIRKEINLGININGRKIDMLHFENEKDLEKLLKTMNRTFKEELNIKINIQKLFYVEEKI